MARRIWSVLLIVIPLLLAAGWLASGREIFTKSGRAVDVQVRDELFGTTFVQKQFVRGPIFGYYIGLDLVIAAVVACLIAWGITLLVAGVRRRRAHRRSGFGTVPGGSHDIR